MHENELLEHESIEQRLDSLDNEEEVNKKTKSLYNKNTKKIH